MFKKNIPIYPIMILLALITSTVLIIITSKRYDFDKREAIGLIIYILIGIVFGGKALTYLQQIGSTNNEFDIIKTGLTSYGGLIGGILFGILFSIQFKKNLLDILQLFILPIPLMYALGKIGCFASGCCYGIEYSGIGHVIYQYSHSAPNGVELFPIQLVEAIVFTLIFIYLLNKQYKEKIAMNNVGETLAICGLSKLFLDFFRNSQISPLFSVNKLLSIIFVIIGIIIITQKKKDKRIFKI